MTVDSIPLSFFVDSITYIDLENSDECLLSCISQAAITDSTILILDKKLSSVVSFDRVGKFQGRIGSRGHGPDEFVRPAGIDIYKDTIYVFDDLRCVAFRYDRAGNIFGTDSIGYFDEIAVVKNDMGASQYISVAYNMPENYTGIFSISENTYRRKKLQECDEVSIRSTAKNEIYRDDDRLFVTTRDWESKVMLFEDDSLSIAFDPDIYPHRTKDEAEHWQGGYDDACKFFYRTAFRMSGRWLLYSFWRKDNPRFIVCDLQDNKVIVGKSVYNDFDNNTTFGFLPSAYNGAMLATTRRNGGEDSNPSLMFLHLKK